MIKKLLPLLALAAGLASGGAAAVFVARDSHDVEDVALERKPSTQGSGPTLTGVNQDAPDSFEIVKMPSQFVVPVITNARVRAMIILNVALEVETGSGDQVRALEPKLRDEFLAELFGLAAHDGFTDGLITRQTLEIVKHALTERSKEVLKLSFVNVLITDMARQDVF